MKKFAVIVAGGSGLRMGQPLPKQFLTLQGKPILWHTLHAFFEAFPDLQVILVLPEAHMGFGEEMIALFQQFAPIQLVAGGNTRFQSVHNGLQQVESESIVFVHDGVRCLITPTLIRQCYEQALATGAAIPAVKAIDSIRMATSATQSKVVDRDQIHIIQTPQTFKSDLLLQAFQQPYNNQFTDEATVMEAAGFPVYLIDGEYTNIKITRPIDLVVAEKILEERLSL